jgi:hypothetical protein
MVRRTILVLVVAMALLIASVIVPACAQLVSTSFGFPTIVQTGSTTAFTQDTANALNYQNVDISFPTAAEGTVPFGAVNLAFPSISQTSLQTQSATHTDFSQTNEFAEFAYPFVGVGAASLPGFGFGL